MNTNQDQLAACFTEWKRRFQEDPKSFDDFPGINYGEGCAKFLIEIHNELFPQQDAYNREYP